MKRNNIRTSVITVCLLGITACLLLLMPQVRQMIIKITEQFIMGRELKNHSMWHIVLFVISVNGNILFGFLFCFLFFDYKKQIASKTRKAVYASVIIVCLLGMTACLLLLIPQARQMIIKTTEQFIMGRELKNHSMWHIVLFVVSVNGNILFGFIFCYLFFDYKKQITSKVRKDVYNFLNNCKYLTFMNNEIRKVFCKDVVVAILCMVGLYAFGIIGIIRADFFYMDDLGRTMNGYRSWNTDSRYISDFLAVLLHADTRITDISPLPQVVAALFIAVASVFLVYVISGGKVTKTACFLTLPIGLSPYFLECFSFRFDAPYMALSVLASIAPFLFMRDYAVFSACSIVSLLIMCMTYQASSGIYIIIVIILCFKAWNGREKTGREIIRFAAVSALSYCASLIFFRLFLMKNRSTFYSSTEIYPIHRLFPGIANNFLTYIRNVNTDFVFIWKFLLFILCLTFLFASLFFTKRNKIAALTLSLAALAAMCVMSFGGVYLALVKQAFLPRYMLGFGVFIACLAVYLSNITKKIVLLPAVLLCWYFFVFSFTYGNALSQQKRYINFRTEILLHDLSLLFPGKIEDPLLIKLKNSAGFAPSIQNISIRNPVIRRLVPIHLMSEWIWGSFVLIRYYNFNLQRDESIEEDGLNEIFDSYYHTIKSDGRKILVILK